MKKKILAVLIVALSMVSVLAGCGSNSSSGASGDITVISREDGSGTRGAFIELFGIEEKDGDEKVDKTIDSADITNSTSVMLTSVEGNTDAIGYVSLGSLSDSVKAVKIDGAEATAENVSNGTYKVVRPFNVVTKADMSDLAKDFMAFVMSADGQAVVEKEGYIKVDGAGAAYAGTKPSGSLSIAGSSSVTPVMEKLKEAYVAINPNATVEVQQSDSTTGVTSAADGVCDIGMASRDLKDSEKSKGVTATAIAQDGIAVIVNKENTIDNLTTEQVKAIYTGETTTWDDLSSQK